MCDFVESGSEVFCTENIDHRAFDQASIRRQLATAGLDLFDCVDSSF
jgi:hypothetical protein